VKLALEITAQIASGLTAVHEQNLVHRDIKPSTSWLGWRVDSATAKIIDLGLAKAVAESQSETAISIPEVSPARQSSLARSNSLGSA